MYVVSNKYYHHDRYQMVLTAYDCNVYSFSPSLFLNVYMCVCNSVTYIYTGKTLQHN